MSPAASKATKREIEVTLQTGFHDDEGPTLRTIYVKSGPTVADVAAAVMRAMKVTKTQTRYVEFSTHVSTANGTVGTSILATLRNAEGRRIRQALTNIFPSIRGAIVQGESLAGFLCHFTNADVFTSTRDQVIFYFASRSAKAKREDGLLAAFRALPAGQQTALLKALRVGPAVVLKARGAR